MSGALQRGCRAGKRQKKTPQMVIILKFESHLNLDRIMASANLICIPSAPLRQLQIECNAPLNAFKPRVEKRQVPSNPADESPRAQETAVLESERTKQRQQMKEERLQHFMEQTRARLSCNQGLPQKAFSNKTKEVNFMDEKTRRRLDQSMNLIPKPASTLAGNKRVMIGSSESAEIADADRQILGPLPALEVAYELGDAVHSGLTECMRARESLLAHKRSCLAHDEDTQEVPTHHFLIRHHDASEAGPVNETFDRVNQSLRSLAADNQSDFWEGKARQQLKECKAHQVVFSEIRRSTMTGERLRVQELRREREQEAARRRATEAERRRRAEAECAALTEEERRERERQRAAMAAIQAKRAQDRELERRLAAPRRQAAESARFAEARRQWLADALAARGAPLAPLCACAPPRTAEDGRLHLCAHNCPLRNCPRAYHRLLVGVKQAWAPDD